MTKLLLVKQTYQYSRYNRWLTCVYMAASAFHKGTNHPRVEDNLIAERNPTIPEVRGQTKLAPRMGSGLGTIKQQAESPFDDDSCHRVLSQPGSPSKGPRSCRKFTQTFLRKGKYMQHGKFLQKAALLWIKIKSHFLYQKHVRGCRAPELLAADRCCSVFLPGTANTWLFLFSEQFLFWGAFPVLADRTAHDSYHFLLSDGIFPFFQYIFHFSDNKLPSQLFGFALTEGTTGCLPGFKVPSCASKRLAVLLRDASAAWARSSQAGTHFLHQFFSRHHLLLSVFSLLTKPPLWLLTSHVYCSDLFSSDDAFIGNSSF